MSKVIPDFEKTKYSISLDPEFLSENNGKFSALKKEFGIADDYPLENDLIEAFIRYIQERESISEKAKKAFVKSFSGIQKLTDKLLAELRQLSGEEEIYLNLDSHFNYSFLSVHKKQLRILRRTLKSAISDLSENSKVGREMDFVTLRLANNLLDIFIKSTGKKPKIYKSEYSDSGYRGTLYNFVERICDIFKTKTETNLYTKLHTAYQNQKTNSVKGKN